LVILVEHFLHPTSPAVPGPVCAVDQRVKPGTRGINAAGSAVSACGRAVYAACAPGQVPAPAGTLEGKK